MKRLINFLASVLTVVALMMAAVYCTRQGATAATTAPANATTTAATAPATAKDLVVEIDNFAFKPKELTVAVGTKVTWTNKDDVPHTATSTDDTHTFDSKTLDTDDKYSFTFTTPGTYKYFCKVHPHMTGVVIVK